MASQISRSGEVVRVEARTMRLLVFLAENAGKVVSIDDLLENVWAGVVVTQDSVYQAVASLRRTLGDDPKQPSYIATVPRQGYRMVATVGAWVDEPATEPAGHTTAGTEPDAPARAADISTPTPAEYIFPAPVSRRPTTVLIAFTLLLVGSVLLIYFSRNDPRSDRRSASVDQHSIAVLPFLDLTSEAMDKEYFADGLTEELIDRLSKVPGLRVPAPTASFYFKGRKMAPKDIASKLNVAFLLDGSIRKSGTTVRVAARLLRADTGFVVWSDTYDRPSADELAIQDDIASQVTRALSASVDRNSAP